MTQALGNRDTFSNQKTNHALPLPPPRAAEHNEEMAIYARFMRHLRHVPNSRMDIKILSAIQFTADMLDYSDAHIAKTLVDLGLRAPRIAFPADFLSFIDHALLRSEWDIGGPSEGMKDLKAYWDEIGEDKFAAIHCGSDLLLPCYH
tara:strand:- start:178 stop:618 length:441 start_codon:yes stop_codon:yes gene_type:complete